MLGINVLLRPSLKPSINKAKVNEKYCLSQSQLNLELLITFERQEQV
jgi:hypothetical protein